MAGAPLASVSAVFDGNGRAAGSVGPQAYGSRWNVDLMVVSTTSTNVTTCKVYRGVEQPTAMVDNTRTGNQDASDCNIDLRAGETLLFVWAGGTPGALASASINGTLYTGR